VAAGQGVDCGGPADVSADAAGWDWAETAGQVCRRILSFCVILRSTDTGLYCTAVVLCMSCSPPHTPPRSAVTAGAGDGLN
jgi:hypothetical protein